MIEGAAAGEQCTVEAADEKSNSMNVDDGARCVALAIDAAPPPTSALTVCGEVATSRQVAEILADWFPEAKLVTLEGEGADLVAEFDPAPALPSLPSSRESFVTANAARQRAGLPPVV